MTIKINPKSILWKIRVLFSKLKHWFFWKKYKLSKKSIPSIVGEGSKLLCKYHGQDPFVVEIKKIWVEFGRNGDYDKFYIMADTTHGMSTLNALLEHFETVEIL